MSVYAPSLSLEHCLNHPKGWFAENALDHAAKFSANINFTPYGGRVVHLNNAGEFEMGVEGTQMAIFLLNGEGDFDVTNPGRSASGRFINQAISPNGTGSGLVATGGYLLESTEFDQARTYAANDLLTAEADNDDEDVGGVLTNESVVQYETAVCGVCSGPAFRDEHDVPKLPFWPVYLPAAA